MGRAGRVLNTVFGSEFGIWDLNFGVFIRGIQCVHFGYVFMNKYGRDAGYYITTLV